MRPLGKKKDSGLGLRWRRVTKVKADPQYHLQDEPAVLVLQWMGTEGLYHNIEHTESGFRGNSHYGEAEENWGVSPWGEHGLRDK